MSLAEAHALLTAPGAPFEMEEIHVHGRLVRAWKKGPLDNRDLLARARVRPGLFLIHNDERITFNAFHRAVAALAAHFPRIGIKKGDRVAIAMRNLPEWPVAYYATLAIGAIAVPLNGWWTGAELGQALTDSAPAMLIADAERLARLEGPLPEHVLAVRAEGAGASLEEIIGGPENWSGLPDDDLPASDIGPDDDATIFYTSGTTDSPKGAIATHRNGLCNIMGAACAAARAALRRDGRLSEPGPDAPPPVALLAVPFFHVTGCFAVLSPALHDGMTLVLMRRWDAGGALRLIEQERVTAIVGVPATAWQLLEHPDRGRHDLSSLVSLGYGGAAAAPALAERLRAEMPLAVPGHGWGMTETSALTTTHAAEDYAARPRSCGAPIPVVDLRIVDAQGQEMPVGDVGELQVRGPNVVRGYWNRTDETRAAFSEGWLRTGDIARLDAEGFLFILDRAKDIVIRGGENIHSLEVENVLYEHPAIVDAGLIGLPHRTLGEVPAAVVTLGEGMTASEAEIRAHVTNRLAAFKVPERILLLRTPLPRNANGKLLKHELRAMLLHR